MSTQRILFAAALVLSAGSGPTLRPCDGGGMMGSGTVTALPAPQHIPG